MHPLKIKAIEYLARREHSVKELQTKLAHHSSDPQEIQTLLAELLADNTLSPARFLESRIRHRLHQGYGRLKITQELAQVHGFKNTDIHAAFDHLSPEESELDQLQALLQKKYPDFESLDPTATQKIIKKLMQRGFRYDLIRQLVKHS